MHKPDRGNPNGVRGWNEKNERSFTKSSELKTTNFKEARMRIIQLMLCAAILAFSFSTTHGAEKVDCNDMGPAGTDYDNIQVNEDGSIKKITAIGEGDVDFADERSEIREAREVAEMEAKAALAHFMKEDLKSDKSVDTIMNKITEMNKIAGKKSKKINKKTMRTQIRKIHNSAQSLLKGLVVLEECYDSEGGYYRVKIGTNEKTMRAADSLRQKSHEDALSSSSASGSSGSAGARAETGESATKKIDSFRRKSKTDF